MKKDKVYSTGWLKMGDYKDTLKYKKFMEKVSIELLTVLLKDEGSDHEKDKDN